MSFRSARRPCSDTNAASALRASNGQTARAFVLALSLWDVIPPLGFCSLTSPVWTLASLQPWHWRPLLTPVPLRRSDCPLPDAYGLARSSDRLFNSLHDPGPGLRRRRTGRPAGTTAALAGLRDDFSQSDANDAPAWVRLSRTRSSASSIGCSMPISAKLPFRS